MELAARTEKRDTVSILNSDRNSSKLVWDTFPHLGYFSIACLGYIIKCRLEYPAFITVPNLINGPKD